MPGSVDEDQDQRKNTSMEGSNAMTIEFLRARLLSERSVSKTARQRADELAKRVRELEQQLKIVTLQRMRAEKATVDVLAILESHGASDVSEAYDSSSEREATPCGSEVGHSSLKDEEALANGKLRRKDEEAFSGYEHQSSPSIGRSLSWKSGKDSTHSLEKKHKDSSGRRHSGFISSASSSPKHVGKSCRQIRRRETRSAVEESQSEATKLSIQSAEVAAISGVPNDFVAETLNEGSQNHEEQYLPEDPEVLENQRVTKGHYFSCQGGDEEMEKALKHQAQLIGRYEEEEKAQREWEEKFRENNHTPDSCDLGNHSDVTEERDENRAPAPTFRAETFTSHNEEAKLRAIGVGFSKESETPTDFQPQPHFDMGSSQNQESSILNDFKTSRIEFASSMAKGSHDCDRSDPDSTPHVNHFHGTPGNHVHKEVSGSTNELSLTSHDSSNKLGSVLEALQQAKLSLKQNLNKPALLEGGSTGKLIKPVPDRFLTTTTYPYMEMRSGMPTRSASFQTTLESGLNSSFRYSPPVGVAGLFRLPTDFQFEATARANFQSSISQPNLRNYSSEPTGVGFFSIPCMEHNRSITSSGDQILTTTTYPYMEIRSGMPTRPSTFQNITESGLNSSFRYSSPDLNLSAGRPSAGKYDYPDLMPRMQSDEELSRALTHGEVRVPPPPPTNFSFYDGHARPNMYR